jgi:hypothetical protein
VSNKLPFPQSDKNQKQAGPGFSPGPHEKLLG